MAVLQLKYRNTFIDVEDPGHEAPVKRGRSLSPTHQELGWKPNREHIDGHIQEQELPSAR